MAPVELKFFGPRNEEILAVLRPLDLISDILSWYTHWLPEMYDLAGNRLYEDSHWKVPGIWEELQANRNYRIMLIEAEELIQGYSIVKVLNHMGVDDKPCSYLAFIAVAPWNRSIVGPRRRIKGIGKVLFSWSLITGLRYNDNLAIELHSLPGAEGFYRHLGMMETGRSKEGMREFRLEKREALALVRPLLPSITKKEK